jgi:hypothetical protein
MATERLQNKKEESGSSSINLFLSGFKENGGMKWITMMP